MKTPNRAPIFEEDKPVFVTIWKKIGILAALAAGLGHDFVKFSRHYTEFGALCCGSTSFQRLFAEVASRPPAVPSSITRQYITSCFEAGINRGVGKLADDGDLTQAQAAAISDAAAGIVAAVSKDLQYLAVDRITFERRILDRILLEARAPRFEYAITLDRRAAFVFDLARQPLRQVIGHNGESLENVEAAKAQDIMRNSVIPLPMAMQKGYVPLDHIPVVLSDEGGDVVGISFQHPVHQGVVPVCCEDEVRFWGVAGALRSGEIAQSKRGANQVLHYGDPTNLMPYFPSRGNASMFSASKDDQGPAVYYSQVSVEKAIAYLMDLHKAINGERVRCTEPVRHVLKSASLSSTDLVSGGKRRTYWGLQSFQSQRGQSKIMSASGTTKGIVVNGQWADQWYLRQIYWLEDANLPALRMPSDHFLAAQPNADVTKIIPDGVEDFTCRALEHINKMPKDQQHTPEIREIAAKLQNQKKQLQKIKEVIEAEASARAKAAGAGFAAVGPEVLPM